MIKPKSNPLLRKDKLDAKEKELADTERSLRAKENDLAGKEIAIKKRYEDAEFGFKKN